MNSLGLHKPPAETRVVVAMSGGVDSSVTAAMLHDQGYDVVGITLQLYDYGSFAGKKGACCAGQDIYDAKNVADKCGFPHYVLNYENMFKESVIDDFADSYLRGETPIPCVRCNQRVKFQDLLKTARELNADVMATGHYVKRLQDENGRGQLVRGLDQNKDQSYFLFATTQEQLDFLRFPLGDMTKTETRALAERYGLVTADKPDSQDICFVPDGDYAKVIQKLRPGAIEGGDIVHIDGRRLGRHEGIIHYTIGQRKGLGLGGGETLGTPLFVVGLKPETNEVVVGPREALARNFVVLKDFNWLGDAPLNGQDLEIKVKMRSAQSPIAAIIRLNEAGIPEVTLDQPYYGVSPGQACVAYDGDRVLGGGWIDSTENTAFASYEKKLENISVSAIR
ncbi:MAG: tRNA 2-thiouridine(34) synthase MnmA [Alphaproteobacteria bacterium]|nr:tRNA 2-thiouridine(34) synthase MnmA [Alphaproteobacteria bacterium]